MENASKALVIAGAILISILLITLGIIVYNGSRSTIDSGMGSMDETTITMTNSKLSQYVGDNVSSTQIRSLISQVDTANKKNSVKVKLYKYTGATPSGTTEFTDTPKTGATYTVAIPSSAYNSEGYITAIYIKDNTPTTP